jgi:hypothetical protein
MWANENRATAGTWTRKARVSPCRSSRNRCERQTMQGVNSAHTYQYVQFRMTSDCHFAADFPTACVNWIASAEEMSPSSVATPSTNCQRRIERDGAMKGTSVPAPHRLRRRSAGGLMLTVRRMRRVFWLTTARNCPHAGRSRGSEHSSKMGRARPEIRSARKKTCVS